MYYLELISYICVMENIFYYNTRPKDEKEAQERADILAKELQKIFGCVWKTRVHFNTEWNYECFAGTLTFYASYQGYPDDISMTFSCMIADKELSPAGGGYGSGVWAKCGSFNTTNWSKEIPTKEKIMEIVYSELDRMVCAVADLEKIRNLNVKVFGL
jgi:hypothetical protein